MTQNQSRIQYERFFPKEDLLRLLDQEQIIPEGCTEIIAIESQRDHFRIVVTKPL